MSPSADPATMQAVRFERFGGPEVLRYGPQPRPVPRPAEVLVEVHAAGVNPRDHMLVAGTYVGRRLVGSPPIVPGSDVSGVIVQVGSRVSGLRVGDAVFGMAPSASRMGGYAEYVAMKASCLAHKPAQISHLEAAALPCAGLTAWQALFDIAKLGAGASVTIVGAAGGVGHYATQLARWAGVEVTAVCGPANLDFAEELGAARVIDYRAEDYTTAVADQDAVLDTVGRTPRAALSQALGPRGVHITTVPTPGVMVASLLGRLGGGQRSAAVIVRSRQADLTSLGQLMAAGDLRSEIAEVLPLAEAAQAQRLSAEGHTRGKLVLAVREDGGSGQPGGPPSAGGVSPKTIR